MSTRLARPCRRAFAGLASSAPQYRAALASLYELCRLIPTLPLESLEYHDRREDFVKWAETTLGDGGLASCLRRVANRRYQGEELRAALEQVVSTHYEEIRRSR